MEHQTLFLWRYTCNSLTLSLFTHVLLQQPTGGSPSQLLDNNSRPCFNLYYVSGLLRDMSLCIDVNPLIASSALLRRLLRRGESAQIVLRQLSHRMFSRRGHERSSHLRSWKYASDIRLV